MNVKLSHSPRVLLTSAYWAAAFFCYLFFSQWVFAEGFDASLANMQKLALNDTEKALLIESDSLHTKDTATSEIKPEFAPDLASDPSGYYKFIIDEVLNGEDFGETKIEKSWRLKEKITNKEERESEVPEWLINIIEFFEAISDSSVGLAQWIEVLLWILVAVIVGFLLIRYKGSIAQFVSSFSSNSTKYQLPSEMLGLDIRRESLPDHIVDSAKKLWQEGQQRQGLALLLRASLSHLLHEKDCFFHPGDTEINCYQKIKALNEEKLTECAGNLIQAWQQLAYAHKMPSYEEFVSICRQWDEVFDAG